MDINKKTVVVVGGASGLGEATCRELVKKGAQIIIFDREKEKADQIAVELNSRAFQADVTDTLSLEKAFSSSGPIHAVINTAGICPAERVLGKEGIASLTHFERAISVNLVGSFNVLRLAAKIMSEQEPLTSDGERGVVINTASIAAYELTRVGIRIMTIAPGVFQTPMMSGLSEKVSNALSESVPFPKRLGFPQEYAALVVHILENSYLNGGTIRLDGALRMS